MAKVGTVILKPTENSVTKGKAIKVQSVLIHPQKTGREKKDGKPVKAHHVTDIDIKFDGKSITTVKATAALSENPYIAFYVRPDKTGKISIEWKDNQGGSFKNKNDLEIKVS